MLYNFEENKTIENINASADTGWNVESIFKTDSEGNFGVFYYKGVAEPFQEITASADTDAVFYLNKTISYGDITLFMFLVIFLVWSVIVGLWKFVYPRNFKN
jgi:hypothetical protein